MDDDQKCLDCRNVGNKPVRLTRMPIGEGIAIFVMSSTTEISETIHFIMANFLEAAGKTLSEELLNKEVAEKYVESLRVVTH
ncbi:MAG: hypothetical protein ACLP7A_13345 [Desulfobaccales bacterium]